MLTFKDQEQQINTTKLYVSNIPFESDRQSLTAYFSRYGRVLQCSILFRNTKYAFIHYASLADVENVLRNANKMFLMGHKLTVKLSRTNTGVNNSFEFSSFNADAPSPKRYMDAKLYVSNLPENCNERELKSLFEQYGGYVKNCVIMCNQYAFVHFTNINEAHLALTSLHGFFYNGKHLNVQSYNHSTEKLNDFQSNHNNSSSSSNKLESSILCYRASDCETPKQSTDWIQLIENGSLPVLNENQSGESLDTENGESLSHLPLLSDIPTPECPDFFSIKIPALKSNAKKMASPVRDESPEKRRIKADNDLLKNLIKQINEKNENRFKSKKTESDTLLNYIHYKKESLMGAKKYENPFFSLVKEACYAK